MPSCLFLCSTSRTPTSRTWGHICIFNIINGRILTTKCQVVYFCVALHAHPPQGPGTVHGGIVLEWQHGGAAAEISDAAAIREAGVAVRILCVEAALLVFFHARQLAVYIVWSEEGIGCVMEKFLCHNG